MTDDAPTHEAPAIFNSKTRPQSADDEISNFGKVNYLEVTRHQHDQRLDNFLLNRLKGLPKSHIYKMIRSDEVRVNNKRCKAHDRVQREDVVRIAPVELATRDKPIISTEFAKSLLARVVYEDEGLLVLNKPSGIAVHGGSGLDFGVIEAMREVTGKKYLELIHRIDKDTSGLLMISKKRSTLKVLQQHLVDKTIQKHYLCLAKGQPALNEQRINAPLLRYTLASGERRVKVDAQDLQAKESQTDIIVHDRFMINGQPVSLIEAKPLTGRTHQIRVHLAHIGHAILGDDKYNVHDKSGVHRLCLHAWRLDIPGYDAITAPLPDDMADWLPETTKLPE
ncbi:RluA family pseudouridine synthase [Psychrobacter sp. Ps6]|uniref:RluA family pseudouridine synthase n=1 Tax=Psychrobacter sp. Ps6 TaxID=2790960 RepID=UPI001EE153F8|nr:RluA family pseudouridine synthase [Psychrobacter sp. Ps6]MCG3878250.1 RluA family pseudouridine synthase [Psychrobacter sp. Ps6]